VSGERQVIRERRSPNRPFHASAQDRHQLDLFDEGTRIKRVNTMLLPGASLEEDIRAINDGEGYWLGNNRWEVNDRIYVHKGDGTVFPISGDLVISPTRPELTALRHLIAANGDAVDSRKGQGEIPISTKIRKASPKPESFTRFGRHRRIDDHDDLTWRSPS
jgi:hypothetical protein